MFCQKLRYLLRDDFYHPTELSFERLWVEKKSQRGQVAGSKPEVFWGILSDPQPVVFLIMA